MGVRCGFDLRRILSQRPVNWSVVYDLGAAYDQGGAGKHATPSYSPLDPIPHHQRKITGSISAVNETFGLGQRSRSPNPPIATDVGNRQDASRRRARLSQIGLRAAKLTPSFSRPRSIKD
jgi:hypothetical protein